MRSYIESVEWGIPALSLLSKCKELVDELPTLMIIRHSERNRIESIDKLEMAEITPLGKKAAHEFGLNPPRNRRYRLYYMKENE
jgi:hypothetical protein